MNTISEIHEIAATISVPNGDDAEMSQAVRYYLGQPLGLASNTGRSTLREHAYEDDISRTVKAMRYHGYLGICLLGPEGSDSHIVAEDLTAQWHKEQTWKLNELKRDYHVDEQYAGNKRRPEYKLVDDMPSVLDEVLRKQPIYGRVGILPIVSTLGGVVLHRSESPRVKSSTNLAEILRNRPKILGVIDLVKDENTTVMAVAANADPYNNRQGDIGQRNAKDARHLRYMRRGIGNPI